MPRFLHHLRFTAPVETVTPVQEVAEPPLTTPRVAPKARRKLAVAQKRKPAKPAKRK